MTPTEIAQVVGAGVASASATGVVVFRLYKRYVHPVLESRKRTDEEVKTELGVGIGVPLHETVNRIANAVDRVDGRLADSDRRLSSEHKLLRDRVDSHDIAIAELNGKHETLHVKGCSAIQELSGKHEALAKRVADLGPPEGMAERRGKKPGGKA